MKKIFFLISLLFSFAAMSQDNPSPQYNFTYKAGVGVVKGSINPVDAALVIGDSATTKAMIIPRVQSTASIVNPRQGMIVWSITDQSFYVRSLSSWNKFAPSTSVSKLNWWNVVIDGGGDPTGVVDVGAIINSAMASGQKMIYMPTGRFSITTPVLLKDSVTIIGDGRNNTIIVLSTNITAFKIAASTGGYRSQLRDFGFLGTFGTGGDINQKGIFIDSAYGVYVHNIGSLRIGGWAVQVKRNGYCCGNYANRAPRANQLTNIYATDGYGGVALDTLAEYNELSNSTFTTNTYGIFVAGGNNLISNNSSNANAYNFYLTGGANDGHGIATGNIFNHATNTNIYITGITLGFSFINTMVYAGTNQLAILNSNDIAFIGGDIVASTNATITNSTNTRFTSVNFRTMPTWIITGEAPTISSVGKVSGATSILDVGTSKEFDILYSGGNVDFSTGTLGSATPKLRISANGNILMGTTTDDNINKLQVTGGTKLSSLGDGSTTRMVTVDLNGVLGAQTISGGGSVTNVSSGNANPLFNISVATQTSTPTFSFTQQNAAANTYLGNSTGSPAAPSFVGFKNNYAENSQTITSGASTTITDGNTIVYINPSSVLASHTITMPPTPQDKQFVKFFYGGTISAGSPVVTTLSIVANTGQTLYQSITPNMANGADEMEYRYETSTTSWRRIK